MCVALAWAFPLIFDLMDINIPRSLSLGISRWLHCGVSHASFTYFECGSIELIMTLHHDNVNDNDNFKFNDNDEHEHEQMNMGFS